MPVAILKPLIDQNSNKLLVTMPSGRNAIKYSSYPKRCRNIPLVSKSLVVKSKYELLLLSVLNKFQHIVPGALDIECIHKFEQNYY